MKKYYTGQAVLYYDGNFCFQLCYHSENMQLVTYPVDTVKTCGSEKKIEFERAMKTAGKILYLHLSNLSHWTGFWQKKCGGKTWVYCPSRHTIPQWELVLPACWLSHMKDSYQGIYQKAPSTQTNLNPASASKLEWKPRNLTCLRSSESLFLI